MMRVRYPYRIITLILLILLISVSILLKIVSVINNPVYEAVDHLKDVKIKAERGNIYSKQYKLLAVTTNSYNVHFDGTYLKASRHELGILAEDLSKIFKDKTKKEYLNALIKAKKQKFYLLKRDASISQIDKLKEIGFYKKPLNGGIIINQINYRKKPNKNLASRTIGDLFKDDNTPIYGLEYSYNNHLMGIDGRQLVLEEPGFDRFIMSSSNISPKTGYDLITTIELKYQDVIEKALLRQLEAYEAKFGTAILMSVKTGEIKAIANLTKNEENKYAETYNYGAAFQYEPGSTFKLASIMAYIEDFNGDINDTIDCKNGKYRFKGAPIPTLDSEKLGLVSLKEAFSKSSNVGIGRLITKKYNSSPKNFISRIYDFGINERSKIDLEKIPKPKIPFPGSKSWSGISLPWMSYGYGVSLTPLDILTFYNTVANNGKFVHPHLGYSLQKGSFEKRINTDVISHKICSEATIKKAHELLREVVLTGTAKSLKKLPFPVSGKTGTTVKNYKNKNKKQYQASFVGFFPSDNPAYSCVVLVDSPDVKKGFYGAQIALPVFKEIASEIYLMEGLFWGFRDTLLFNKNSEQIVSILNNYKNLFHKSENNKNYPSVIGMHLTDAILELEKRGFEVLIKGDYGVVKKQYPKAGARVIKDLAVTIFI